MNGTWRTTGGGSSVVPALVAGVVAVVVIVAAVEWVLARIWWILGGTAVVAVLVILAVRWLVRWQQRREAAYGEQRAAIRHGSAACEIPALGTQPAALNVHHHYGPEIHVAPGTSLADIARAIPAGGTAVTEEE
jgi:hypothetical protein